ncbi:MAG: nucleotidyltransferase domain-containing protein [Candidatus Hydrothermales bacterium]
MVVHIYHLKEPYRSIIKEIFKNVKNFYKKNLISFVVFGSVAKNKTNPFSDIDLLIICENLPKGRTKRILDFMKNIERPLKEKLKKLREKNYFIEISPIIKKPNEVEYGGFIYLDMIDDSIILFDKNKFFKNYLEKLSNKLKEYGAKKIYKKGGYYWIIKKDVDVKIGVEI